MARPRSPSPRISSRIPSLTFEALRMIIQANHRILLVDDNPAIHQDFKKILLASETPNEVLDAAEAALFDDQPKKKEKKSLSHFSIDSAFQGREALDKV